MASRRQASASLRGSALPVKPADPPGWYLFYLSAGVFGYRMWHMAELLTWHQWYRIDLQSSWKQSLRRRCWGSQQPRPERKTALPPPRRYVLPSSCSNVHTQEKPSSGSRWISLIGDRARVGRSWHRFGPICRVLNIQKSTSMQNARKRDDGLVKKERLKWGWWSMSTGSVNNRERQPADQPPLEKRGETSRTFQGSRGIQPCKLWVAANLMAISGGGPWWSLRIDYDARSFLSFLVVLVYARCRLVGSHCPVPSPKICNNGPPSGNPRISLSARAQNWHHLEHRNAFNLRSLYSDTIVGRSKRLPAPVQTRSPTGSQRQTQKSSSMQLPCTWVTPSPLTFDSVLNLDVRYSPLGEKIRILSTPRLV